MNPQQVKQFPVPENPKGDEFFYPPDARGLLDGQIVQAQDTIMHNFKEEKFPDQNSIHSNRDGGAEFAPSPSEINKLIYIGDEIVNQRSRAQDEYGLAA